MRSRHVTVSINLGAVREAAESIRRRTGVPLIAIVKADAYGLGARPVADVLAGVADEFGYFSLEEAQQVGRPGIVLGPPQGEAAEHRDLGVRPSGGSVEDASRFGDLPVAVNVDTGMQRFGCPPDQLDDLLSRCRASELFTHADSREAALRLRDIGRGRGLRMHAACSSLLDDPDTWLDAVRPGLALYRGAVRVSARLVAVRETQGPVGYGGFECPRVGVILAGYAHGVQPAPVWVNGWAQRILEAGMNTAFVSVDAADRVGDEVVLLGDGLTEAELARDLNIREHEVLCRYCGMGRRGYVAADSINPPVVDTRRSSGADPRRT